MSWRGQGAVFGRRPLLGWVLLAAASLVAYIAQGGMSERLRTTWHLANAYDRAVSATMPGGWLFRAAVAWVPRQLPGTSGTPAAPFLAAMLGYALSVAVLFALYALALGWMGGRGGADVPRRRLLWLVGGAGAIFSLVLLFTPAAPSHDPFAYAMSGRLMLTYHANPFFAVPAAYPGDPILAANDWQTSATAYGPLWSGLSLLLAPLIGADPLRANLVYRVVALVAHLANLVLLAGLLGRLSPAARRAWQARGLLLYAWNPLVVIEVAAGHNDVVMLTLLLVGLYLLARGRSVLAMVALAGAILLKASALPLVLLVLAALLMASTRARDAGARLAGGRERWAEGVRLPAVLGGVVLVGYVPFFWGHSLAQIGSASKLQPTTQALAKALTSSFGTLSSGIAHAPGLAPSVAAGLAQAALVLASPTFWTLVQVGLMLAATFFLLPSLPDRERLPSALAWVYAVWMVVLCVFHLLRTWYLVPLVGLASLTPLGRPIRRFVLALTASTQLEVFFLSKSPPFDGWQPWTVVLVLGIPLAVLAVDLRRQGFAPRAAASRGLASLRALRAL